MSHLKERYSVDIAHSVQMFHKLNRFFFSVNLKQERPMIECYDTQFTVINVLVLSHHE